MGQESGDRTRRGDRRGGSTASLQRHPPSGVARAGSDSGAGASLVGICRVHGRKDQSGPGARPGRAGTARAGADGRIAQAFQRHREQSGLGGDHRPQRHHRIRQSRLCGGHGLYGGGGHWAEPPRSQIGQPPRLILPGTLGNDNGGEGLARRFSEPAEKRRRVLGKRIHIPYYRRCPGRSPISWR